MKFKSVYGSGELTLGPFYNTDIRKLVAQRMYFPCMFPDAVTDPQKFMTERVAALNTLFFTLREGKRVIGYSYLDPIVYNMWAMFHVARIYTRRAKRSVYLNLQRLIFKYCFEELGLIKLATGMPGGFKGHEKLARLLGMKHEGTMRAVEIYGGRLTDIMIYGLLRSEWEGK